MADLLPPPSRVDVRGRSGQPAEATLARADSVLFVVEGSRPDDALGALPYASLWRTLHRNARGQSGDIALCARLPNARHTVAAVVFARRGLGGFERLELSRKLVKAGLEPGVASMQCFVVGLADDEARAWREAVTSAVLAAAAPMPHRRSKPPPPCALRRLDVYGARTGEFTDCVAAAAGNHLARWLAALPPNVLDCVAYRKALQQLARREGWTFRFYDERTLARLKAGAFLAVPQASDHRGAGIVRLTRRAPGKGRRPRVALVGKGICFDTGGINLKPHKSMFLMHGDMQGSAVAVGTLLACARAGAPVDIDCWVALSENEIGPRAYRPQDIVRAMNGTTIQVVHSDAEGRMVLADTLTLASRERPDLVLDFATLTGACVNALTDRYSGAFTNRDSLHGILQRVGRDCGERVWCFPMDEDFDLELESTVADVMQCTQDSKGDHILAARFLSRFVEPGVPWVHIDLAAAEHKGGLGHVPTEFTGFGVRYAQHLLADREFMRSIGPRA